MTRVPQPSQIDQTISAPERCALIAEINATIASWVIDDTMNRPLVIIAEATALLDRALAAAYPSGQANAHLMLGGAFAARSDFARATHHLDHANRLFADLNDGRGLAQSTLYRNLIWNQRGEIMIAREYLPHALATARSCGDPALEYWLLNDLGATQCEAGQVEEGMSSFLAAIAVGRHHPAVCDILARFNVAFTLVLQHDYDTARKWLREGLEECDRLDTPYYAHHGARFLGICERLLGRASEARELFHASARYAERATSLRGTAAANYELGDLEISLGERDAALAAFRRSAEAYRQMVDTEPSIFARLCEWWIESLTSAYTRERLDSLLAIEPRLETIQHYLAIRVLEALSISYEQLGDAVTALHYARKTTARKEDYWKAYAETQALLAAKRHQVDQAEQIAESERYQREALAEALHEVTDLNLQNERLVEQLRTKSALLKQQATEDSLTEIFNRRFFDLQIVRDLSRSRRFGRPICIALADIDNFKQINDAFSHQVGDEVLRIVAQTLRNRTRQTDTVARYGGEEFAFIFSETELDAATVIAGGLKQHIEDYPWHQIIPGLSPTLSIGVVEGTGAMTATRLLAAADSMLYLAKHRGKNLVKGRRLTEDEPGSIALHPPTVVPG